MYDPFGFICKAHEAKWQKAAQIDGGTAWSQRAHCCVLVHINLFCFMREQGKNLPQLCHLNDVHPLGKSMLLVIACSLVLFKALCFVHSHYLLVMLFIMVQLNYPPSTYLDMILWNKFRKSRSLIIIITRTTTWFLENLLPSSTPMASGFPTWIVFSEDDTCQMVWSQKSKD